PDVGGSYFLPRCPGEVGMYLALTGARLKIMDALYAGIATHFVPAARTQELLNKLAEGTPFGWAVGQLVENATTAPLTQHRAAIDKCFSGGSVEDILSRLDAEGTEWAAETAKTMRTKSPTSLKITYRQIRDGKRLSFDDCMKMEFGMVNRIIAGHDFYEGVRAAIIEKDNAPKWQPAELAGVTDKDVDAYFAPLKDELDLST
ncbi:MAG TPA: enoyl-CoA hydratase/isomerase family protein, partial [Rhizomicrobium sp.]|nr:enoyl-CoA hydratase/isomerase family protein [Rhizomicrobium sp.]